MIRIANPLRILLPLVLLVAVSHAARASELQSAIEAANAQFSDAAGKGDAAALTALYTADGAVMPAGSDPIRGKAAIQKFWAGALSSGVAAVTLKTVEVYGHGRVATEVGDYELKDKGGKTLDHGKYIVIWRSVGGSWKLLRDMFSTNVAPVKP